MVPALMLVSTFKSFFLFFNRLMVDNGDQYDQKAQAMEEAHFDWRCIVCCMVALSPLHPEQQHLPGSKKMCLDGGEKKRKRTNRTSNMVKEGVGQTTLMILSETLKRT